jgi:hypothetical protein
MGKLVVLRLDDPVLARWLTSDPQHFNSRNDIAVRCLLDPLSPVLPWATGTQGHTVYTADRIPGDHERRAAP